MDVMTSFYEIEIVVGIVVTLAGVPLLVFFWKRMLPLPARTIFWGKRRNLPLAFICHDSGRGVLHTITERRGEGVVVTDHGKYKILPRYLEDKEVVEVTEEIQQGTSSDGQETPQATKVTRRVLGRLKDYSSWIVKRTTLYGYEAPFFLGYSGKICLMNPEALALYELGDMMIKTEDKTLFNPHGIDGKRVEDALQPLLLIDPKVIKQAIPEGYDDSQIAAITRDSEEIGQFGRGFGKFTLPIVIIVIAIVGVLAAIFILPQIMGGGEKKQQTALTLLRLAWAKWGL